MVAKLYIFRTSPPCRAVIMLAKHLKIELDIVELDPKKGEHLTPEFQKINPTQRLPVFIDNDGLKIFDSHAILIYLVEKYATDDSLYPKDLQERTAVNQGLFFENDIIFNGLSPIMRGFMQKSKTRLDPSDYDRVNKVYKILEGYLNEHDWMVMNRPTIVDYSVYSSVISSNCIIQIDSSKYPKLTDWLEKMKTLPGVAADDNRLAAFKNMVKFYINSTL